MTLKLYYDFMSQPARALYIFLHKTQIPFEKVRVNLGKGEHKTPEYKKINPLGLIPVIDDNGFILRESVGIFRYLCRERNLAEHWYPQESKAQAKVDEYLEWQHLGTRFGCGSFFRVTFLEPLLTKKAPLASDVERVKNAMNLACDAFENVWLKDSSKFLFGNKLSIADLLAATELEQPRISGYDVRIGRPKTSAYLDRVKAETNPYYDEAHGILEKIVALNTKSNL